MSVEAPVRVVDVVNKEMEAIVGDVRKMLAKVVKRTKDGIKEIPASDRGEVVAPVAELIAVREAMHEIQKITDTDFYAYGEINELIKPGDYAGKIIDSYIMEQEDGKPVALVLGFPLSHQAIEMIFRADKFPGVNPNQFVHKNVTVTLGEYEAEDTNARVIEKIELT